ncbi:LLM class F420-dependent oxidoreductase [Cellulomonas fimi]|uniref:Putative F420-dependent oxidoreductase n=1 Tax=Cellulomonas fimi (strain ATCC 484 / DSM 20113 / JCM 1341 / CCUG 24087 / LMG 16345 / NBRC 15513 / NCIMB 8980 / NCTC 7547 / NRS-133) TaxID=590998 RepID=F4H4W6_CELFA|nr:LLM class F420-dependent oxidoreductase [Cellulomonas fimi]AEE45446.1 putative F420-dependent oxidoreductase [Cellulomonas fimi ATCC 484]NNH08935.1 LLM class F420-dependent oxidoreductase [Cellulomonas fimi]VEH29414.1 Phthiodiolone/phenolphthiodiolone dimycocerosates ketoreductase [Cellulomonas fimi]
MRVGIHLMRFDAVEPSALRTELATTAEAAEAAGVAWVSVMDHWFQMVAAGFPAEDPMLEAYTTLGYLAARTETVQLGVLVTGVTYRYPGLLAKTVATLDVLSGGRATLGIGAAWYDREHAALGVPFPPLKERFERLEEALQICRQMWDPEQNGPYEGTHYRLAETLCQPQPLRAPEVMVGGGGERKTLRLVAQYADACNLFASTPEEVAHKLDVLRAHCDDVGRDVADIRVTMLHGGDALLRGDVEGFTEEMKAYAALGVETVILRPPATPLSAWVRDAVAPAVPRVAEL